MKRLLVLSAAMLALSASAAFAQLDLSWGNCVGEPLSSGNVNLNCVNARPNNVLYGCFKVPTTVPAMIAIDISIDLQVDAAGLDPYWHFEGVGCNNTGLVLKHDADFFAVCNTNTIFNNPWGDAGGAATPFITAYGPGFGGANRGRLLMSIARGSTDPIALDAGKNWYMWHLLWSNAKRATCAGCPQKVAINWNSATIFSNDGSNPVVLLGGVNIDKLSPCATLNGVSVNATCAATSAKKTSWGQLKSLYR